MAGLPGRHRRRRQHRSANDVGSGGEDDVDDREADETNGLLTGETDNFNDQGHSRDTAKSNVEK